jgi:hypothetical protein
MAESQTPKSAATVRAERRADRARIVFLKRQKQDEKEARGRQKWRSREWLAHDKQMRETDAELRKLKTKKYS